MRPGSQWEPVSDSDGTIQIKGLTKFRTTLKKAGADMVDLKEANVEVADTVVARARAIGPNRTGRLVGSLQPSRVVSRARIRSSLIYAPVIHWGWPKHNIKPDKFVLAAALQTQPQWMAEYEISLQKISNTVQGA